MLSIKSVKLPSIHVDFLSLCSRQVSSRSEYFIIIYVWKKRQGLGRRNDVLTWLQSGHLARWSADISNNSNSFPKANILEARGETAEEIIQ